MTTPKQTKQKKIFVITSTEAKHILAFDEDCGSCHAHKFVEIGRRNNPRFNCKYNKKFRAELENLL